MLDRRTLLISGAAAAAAVATPAAAITPLGRDDIVLGSPRAPVTVIEYNSEPYYPPPRPRPHWR